MNCLKSRAEWYDGIYHGFKVSIVRDYSTVHYYFKSYIILSEKKHEMNEKNSVPCLGAGYQVLFRDKPNCLNTIKY